MSVLAPPPVDPFQPPPGPVWRFGVADYHRLIASGVLGEDDRVELLEGWIVPKMPHNPLHDGTIQIVTETLRGVLPPGWTVRVQSALTTNDSETEPDVAVVRGDSRTFLHRRPGPADVGLIVEVADSTVEQDRRQKARLYARAGVPAYWIVNVADRQVEIFSEPSETVEEPRYRSARILRPGETVALVLDGKTLVDLRVGDLL